MAVRSGGSFRCCCSFCFSIGLTSLFIWLSLRVTSPRCSLEQLYIPSLDQTLKHSTKDTTLTFAVAFKNPNKDKGVFYDPVNVTFFDTPDKRHLIGKYMIPKFYQGHRKKAMKNGTVVTSGIDRRAVSANGSAVFHVDLATSVRYKMIFWKSKKHKIRVGGDVEVNGNGTIVSSKKLGAEPKSAARKIGGGYCWQMGGILVNFAVLILS